jgi:hypothetical protein
MSGSDVEMPVVMPPSGADVGDIRHHTQAARQRSRFEHRDADAAAPAHGRPAAPPRGGASEEEDADDEFASLTERAYYGATVAGTPLEFWLCALAGVCLHLGAVAASRLVKRRAVQLGALLGCGFSTIVLGFAAFGYVLTSTDLHIAFALVPLAVAFSGPFVMHRAVLQWAESEKREGRRHVDILLALLLVLAAVSVVVTIALGFFASALVSAM